MTNDEWEVFKKEIKPIKKSGKVESYFNKKVDKIKRYEKNESFSHIDLEDNFEHTLQIDKNTLKKIRKGKINVSASLDLHGFTIEQSKEKVITFIKKNFNLCNRLVLIITGKGKSLSVSEGWKSDGKLKKNVPVWLSSTYLAKYILWFGTATPEKGGGGALFVYLKKIKE